MDKGRSQPSVVLNIDWYLTLDKMAVLCLVVLLLLTHEDQ